MIKRLKQDFPLIRDAVIWLAVVTALTALGVVGSAYLNAWMTENQTAAERQLKEAHAQLARVRQQQEEFGNFHIKYRQMAAQGILKGENRLEWVESMEGIRKARKLFDVSYQIAAQRPVAADTPPLAKYELRGSAMKLGLTLLHEEDLLRFLADLRKSNTSVLHVQECKIRLTDNERASFGANLQADCELLLLTLNSRTTVVEK